MAHEDAGAQTAEASRFPLAIRSQRVLQIVLGLLWILDAALQFQPYMFGRGFVDTYIAGNATGQPFVVGDLITHVGTFLSPDIAVWSTFFALIQLFIGVGLLFRPTVRPALALSFAWALGVWVIGEGMGMILTGTASALTGAPGSVLLYGLLGLMAWPRRPRRPADWSDRPVGIAWSAAGQGIGRSITPLAVWTGYWSLAAVLFLLPDNRTRTSVTSAIVGMATGQPGWHSHFLTSLGNLFSTTGTQTAWILAAVSVVIGLGPLFARRPGWFLGAGAPFAFLLWIAGQGLVGNTGPAIAQAEAEALLADGNNGPVDVHMAESGCAARLTAGEDIGAEQYVQATSEAVSPYATPAEAEADGYVPASPTDYPVVYYVNPAIVAANAAARRTLDPRYVDGLVYAATPSGTQVLAAAMYILAATETSVPMPYGALVQWHRRTEVCTGTTTPTMPLDITGYPPCPSGSVPQPTPYLSMVWQVPVAGGPLAIQPPDIQIVEAAVMGSAGP